MISVKASRRTTPRRRSGTAKRLIKATRALKPTSVLSTIWVRVYLRIAPRRSNGSTPRPFKVTHWGKCHLALMYHVGDGVGQDYAEAMKWYRKAADQGDAASEEAIGSLYEWGRGVGQDYAEAMKWYRKAADQGNAASEEAIGSLYQWGQGVAKDYAEAVKWYRK